MLLSFYWAPPLKNHHSPSPVGSNTETSSYIGGHNKNRILGPVLMFLCAVAWSLWLIMQPKLLKQYPARLRLSTLQCLLSSVQATVIAAALQRNFDSWKIGWDIQFASLAYSVCLGFLCFIISLLFCQNTFFLHFLYGFHNGMSSLCHMKGVLVTGFTYGLQFWCIEKKGPFYVAMFFPLSLLVTTIFSALVWSEGSGSSRVPRVLYHIKFSKS